MQNKLTITLNKFNKMITSGKFDWSLSILPTTKMSCMLKHFRSRVSAQVEQLCLLAKLCCESLSWNFAACCHVQDTTQTRILLYNFRSEIHGIGSRSEISKFSWNFEISCVARSSAVACRGRPMLPNCVVIVPTVQYLQRSLLYCGFSCV